MSALECTALDERLLDYLYDELPDRERADYEQHVAGCSRCAAEIAAYRRVRQAARALPVEEPSPQVTTRLLEAAAGRNVVPLPLPQTVAQAAATAEVAATAEPPSDEAEPSAAASDFIMAAARARAATAPAASAPAAASVVGTSGPVPITAARRARRWVSHPAFAMAAGLVVVTLGTAYFFTENHKAAEQSPSSTVAMAPPAASPEPALGAVPSPAVTAAPKPPAEDDSVERAARVEPAAPEPAARVQPAAPEPAAEPGSLLAKAEHASRPAPAVALRPAAPSKSLAFEDGRGTVANAAGGDASGSSAGMGARGSGAGIGPSALAHARAPQPAVQPLPPKGRKLDNGAVNLGPEENETLERSVAALDQSAKKRAAPREKTTSKESASQRDELALADKAGGSQGSGGWASPPPAAPVAPAPGPRAVASAPTRSAVPLAEDTDDYAAAPAQEPSTTANKQRSRAQVKASPAMVFQELMRNNRCSSELLEAYQKLKASDPGYAVSSSDRLDVARCYRKAEQFELARSEYQSLRAQHPELARSIDAELAQVNDERRQLAQRRAAEAAPAAAAAATPPPPAPAKAKPKSGKAADAATSY